MAQHEEEQMAFTEALLLGIFCFQHETLEKKPLWLDELILDFCKTRYLKNLFGLII